MSSRSQSLCGLCLLLVFCGCAQYSQVTKRSIAAVAATPEQKSMFSLVGHYAEDPHSQIGHYLDWANAARSKLATDPSDLLAQSNYNFAVSRIVGIIADQDFTPWDAPLVCSSGVDGRWSLRLTPPDPRPEYHPSHFEILPADRYDFKGSLIRERDLKRGLGAPVIVIGEDQDFTKFDEFAQGKQVYYAFTAAVRFSGMNCELILEDPLDEETVKLDRHTYPLAADFQAPLAMALAELDIEKQEISEMFQPDRYAGKARLARLQAYDPKKIPVVFIHGLGDSEATWLPMIDALWKDETIRQNYQFWFFTYPTGSPYPIPAAELRKKLDRMTEKYPDHKDIVVVGHSMGGMIARLIVVDSGMTLWNSAFPKPRGEMGFSEGTREAMSEILIFNARTDISRVIYCSASHRGSNRATGWLGRLGARIVGNPLPQNAITDEVLAAPAPELGSPRQKLDRLPNSIDVLDPDSPFLQAVDTLPSKPGIPYHSIIGDRGKGGNLNHTKPVSSDGIVPYWSSHLDGSESETIIPSDHWSNNHPLGIAEVSRILHLHLGEN